MEPAPDTIPRAAHDTVAIFAFGGAMPLHVADAAARAGYSICMVAFRGYASADIARYPHEWIGLGQVGKMLRIVRKRAIRHIVIVGALSRPKLTDLRLDWTAIFKLPTILKILNAGGDDGVLRRVASFFEGEGLRVVGVHEIAPEFVASAGVIAGVSPSADMIAEAQKGLAALDALSPFDGGQALVMAGGRPVAIEGVEGTDEMMARVADLRTRGRLRLHGRQGALVKAAKRGQDLRLDMPTIGLRTVEGAAAAQLQGIFVEAGSVLMADKAAVMEAARAHGLFIYGIGRTAVADIK
ncbi:MAG: LpxI family protein [Beijerinckiaceae bacterium]